MAGKSGEDEDIGENSSTPASEENLNEVSKKKQKGVLSWFWNVVFRSHKNDFESRLECISKEEAIILSRIRRRSRGWARMRRHIILFSLLLEVIAVGYAIMTTRVVEHWRRRALRVMPMFAVPILSSIMYSALGSFMNMLSRKDEKALEKLRSEKKSKIDELKESTNYYITQQLIQKYDTDPAARAAAAAILASKLGADSGLNVYVGDNPDLASAKKSHDAEPARSSGLRNRKRQHSRTNSIGSNDLHSSGETTPQHMGTKIIGHNSNVFVNHQGGGSSGYSFGWLDRIVALLVGEDPTQCYALICKNCHMHNGLASKEDFPYVSYICPHCRALNGPKNRELQVSGSDSQAMGSTTTVEDDKPGAQLSVTGNFEEGKLVSNADVNPVVPGGHEKMLSERNMEEMLSEGHRKEEMLSEEHRKEEMLSEGHLKEMMLSKGDAEHMLLEGNEETVPPDQAS